MSRYPTIYAGQRVTGTLLQGMQVDIVQKLTNTDRTATTTLADDPDLTTTLEANSRYYIEFEVWYASNTGPSGIKTGWTVPSGVTGNRSALGMTSAASSTTPTGEGRWGVHSYTTAVFYGDRVSDTNLILFRETSLVTVGSTAGTCALQWAQDTSNASAVRVAAGSVMRIQRVA